MKNTSLCYIENDGAYLMMLRGKKQNDENSGKWIGVGGKAKDGESPEECARREISEETGIVPTSLLYRGIVDFCSDIYESERMHLFTGVSPDRTIIQCDEGELCWIEKAKLFALNMWEGDRVFLERIAVDDAPFFHITLTYEKDKLIKVEEHKSGDF